ncbi:MAG: potassium/proton antiporter [Candidatus Accumulibacter regalis]|jgi:NhaP-type Na+/H+ or K+/H+ antiporter|uniref:Potassium/proton antiporter n=1 Tax=Accumulibacter regalis TaxID=522306 RepID=A0A011QAW0_ACCRE|nr:cation:proton antiporter [Accumulibacter sp.]EXI86260.1 MAG: potassium/proton antiporter [Candidatus Accumulibacter regalis]MBN8515324.1 cation:proton antiporter [Accumulibacter sp.]HRE71440.1 cation:proton antiporter [Accumulibacter sp.]
MSIAAAFIVLVFSYSLISRKLASTLITAPILFTAAGALMLLFPEASRELSLDRKALLLIAEVGLVMTLFTDASHISRRALQDNHSLPVRLLSAGMLLTILLGAVAAMACFTDLSWWEAGILAAILAPTDAGLGQVIVNSPQVPARIRQALNVEAGLNDGLAVPFLMLFIALTAAIEEGAGTRGVLARFLLEQIGYGTAIGLAIGLAGGLLMGLAQRRQWMTPELGQLGVVAMPLLCILAAEGSGASMFIAAFVSGLAAQVGFPKVGRHSVEFTEGWGQLFNFFVFFLFGLLFARSWHDFTPAIMLYALLSLTVVRMLPVSVAVAGIGLSRASVLFLGWFGPRGLASIVLGLVYLEQQPNLPGETTIRLAVMATVLMSIVAHGLSAKPGIERYARSNEALPPDAPEHAAVVVPATH